MKGESPEAKPMTSDDVLKHSTSDNIHPAFAYAARKFKALPSAPSRPEFGEAGAVASDNWNAVVEEYIADGHASDAQDIRVAAQVSADGGPRYRRCQSASCGNVEDAPGQYRVCGACKTTFYCSTACQTTAWKQGHKTACKHGATLQLLPSHETFMTVHKMMARMRYLGALSTASMLQEAWGNRS
ncbi:hypothetical protein EXIGLDRAFT_837076 [Exidia glandulosa HHB12029]|uniref:MYND-type domain-containing protein n=1 Tax=Exidia glandulosa HHB12029 TaxID=1314781 RepID=A0A165H614_EXIGL|nr:hypothetical protein EXIGLDRAFT_837076 [Exidia glandulosa HHB12029]